MFSVSFFFKEKMLKVTGKIEEIGQAKIQHFFVTSENKRKKLNN
jgi:hypothetical protein